MPLPTDRVVLKSKKLPHMWVVSKIVNDTPVSKNLTCLTCSGDDKYSAVEFLFTPSGNNAFLYDAKNKWWYGQYFDSYSYTSDFKYFLASKDKKDLFCKFICEEINDGYDGFRLRCDNGQYVAVDVDTQEICWPVQLHGEQDYDSTVFYFEYLDNPERVDITSTDLQPFTLNTSHELTAICKFPLSQLAENTMVYWSSVPEGAVIFSKSISEINSRGCSKVSITAYGYPDDFQDVSVYAHVYNNTLSQMLYAHFPVTWQNGAQPPSGQSVISLTSVDGLQLTSGGLYLLKAVYRSLSPEQPLGGQTITWTQSNSRGVLLEESTTVTDDNGVAVNMVWGSLNPAVDSIITFTASATNPVTGDIDSSSLSVSFTINSVKLDGAGYMLLQANNAGSPTMNLGQEYTLTATYTNADGTPGYPAKVYWNAFPSDRIQLGALSSDTNAQGVATTTITASGNDPIDTANITVSTDNITTGAPDSESLDVQFIVALPPKWSGIRIDKGYSNNPEIGLQVNPKDPTQIITMKMTTKEPGQKISLITFPLALSTKMFDENGNALQFDQNTFVTTSDNNGDATILVGAQSLSVFEVRATAETEITTNLVLGTISKYFSSGLSAPTISGTGVNGNQISVPGADQGYSSTFLVNIPIQVSVTPNDALAIVVNGRLAWQGYLTGGNRSINIAYAMLTAGSNQIAYLINQSSKTYESIILSVTVTGNTPQTRPDSSILRSLPAITLTAQQSIDAYAIVNGLQATVNPGVTVDPGDIISTCFYLSGKDSNGINIHNIIQLNYTAVLRDNVTNGGNFIVTLPQGVIAGYGGDGAVFQADYSLTKVQENTTGWAKVISRKLDTAI